MSRNVYHDLANHHAGVSVVSPSCQCWSEQPANNGLLQGSIRVEVTQQICLVRACSRQSRGVKKKGYCDEEKEGNMCRWEALWGEFVKSVDIDMHEKF